MESILTGLVWIGKKTAEGCKLNQLHHKHQPPQHRRHLQKKPEQVWDNGLQARQSALQVEKKFNQHLLELYKLSKDRIDSHLCEFLDTQYFEKQVKTMLNIKGLKKNHGI
ncbi:ferritin heavy chain A-like [Hemitrygon akajei]|uniref:ferritin heavy chain A-like n=1 Tax=Hemitrygon akajei TaxID=2704970 RepID=UPI003BFA241C